MNFIYPIITVYNTGVSPYQFIQISSPPYVPNSFQAPIFYPTHSPLTDQNTFILPANFSTQESLAASPTQKPAARKKKVPTKKEQDQNFGWRHQNKDRNIMSNMLKALANHLDDQAGMRPYIEELYSKLKLKNDVSEFYEFFKEHFSINRSYISSKQLKAFIRNPKWPSHLLLVLRLVLNRFFRVDFSLVLLKSTKIRNRSKLEQMKKSRELLQSIFKE